MTAYYNEIDPFATAWLRELIRAGHIAPGDVDERSIEDVRPDDLAGYAQCHFFAGIGVWSYALRRAGWPDDRPVWTGSCPCQPFSAAGKGDGFTDERHLWPSWHWLIDVCRPGVVLGEQVANRGGLAWLDLVSADLEGTGYAIGSVDTCAAGYGAPHIRQRLYWVGVAAGSGCERIGCASEHSLSLLAGSVPGGLADLHSEGRSEGREIRPVRTEHDAQHGGAVGGMADAERLGRERGRTGEAGGRGSLATTTGLRKTGGLADAGCEGRRQNAGSASSHEAAHGRAGWDGGEPDSNHLVGGNGANSRSGPTDGLWRDADWLLCRDGRWRPVEPGTFPLAHGASARVGRLRGYGNAIVAPQAVTFIEAAQDILFPAIEGEVVNLRLEDVFT